MPDRGAVVRTVTLLQHLVFLVLWLVCGFRSLTVATHPWWTGVVLLALLGWYVAGLALPRLARPAAPQVWLLVLAGLWALSVVLSPENIWLAFSIWLLAGHVFRLVPAIAFSLLVLAVVVTAPVHHSGVWSVAAIVGPAVGGVFAVGISRSLILLVRQGDELAEAQHESGVMTERERLSRDIHDTLAQGFSSIVLLARAGEESADPARLRAVLEQIEQTAQDNLIDARRLVQALAPADLDDSGLVPALQRLLVRLAQETGVRTALDAEDFPALSTTAEVALLRVAQSALANVRAHATATRVAVSLVEVDGTVRMDVVDDGTGFDAAAWESRTRGDVARGGYGLRAMRDRLSHLGGGLEVESEPGEGVALSAWLPLQATR